MIPERAKQEEEELVRSGLTIRLVELNGQYYAHVEGLEAKCPPWDRPRFEILIAIPAAYDAAELDGFYLCLPYRFNDGEHPRVNGAIIEAPDRKWRQVSWHYPDGKPWTRGQDNLETHIVHCRGFFLHRGAKNDR